MYDSVFGEAGLLPLSLRPFINFEKQNEIYLKISPDLYWETKFARF